MKWKFGWKQPVWLKRGHGQNIQNTVHSRHSKHCTFKYWTNWNIQMNAKGQVHKGQLVGHSSHLYPMLCWITDSQLGEFRCQNCDVSASKFELQQCINDTEMNAESQADNALKTVIWWWCADVHIYLLQFLLVSSLIKGQVKQNRQDGQRWSKARWNDGSRGQ